MTPPNTSGPTFKDFDWFGLATGLARFQAAEVLDVAPQGGISNEGENDGRTQHSNSQEVLREGLTSNRHDGNERVLGCADRAGERRILRLSGETTRNRIDVADQGRGTAPLTESITVGDEGVGSAKANPRGSSDSQTFTCQRNGIDGFISAVDAALDRAEEAEDLGGYPDPAHDPRFA